MKLKTTLPTMAGACLALMMLFNAGSASAQQPNFGPAVYADGEAWGSTFTTVLPAVKPQTAQSYDKLFAFVNGAAGQLAVAEAAPGNRNYNGGRWYVHTAMWTAAGVAAYATLPVLKSYDEVQYQMSMGYLVIAPGSPMGGPPPFFQCPLLPVK